MVENSGIEWTDHTFNPWVGCTKVSPACDNCYAETWAKRTGSGNLWNPLTAPRRTSKTNWNDPIRWNAKAEREGKRARVFCASLADVFDNQVPEEWRRDLFDLIAVTPHLDWLLLTKRPQNIAKMVEHAARQDGQLNPNFLWPWPNVWLGTTVENQAEADRRIPHLLKVPAKVRFLSCEPLLEAVDLGRLWRNDVPGGSYMHGNGIHWVIAGGESGPGARPMNPEWARSLRDQCAEAGVPFLFKQWGEWVSVSEVEGKGEHHSFPDGRTVRRVGKKAAGRLLDGVQHDGFPA